MLIIFRLATLAAMLINAKKNHVRAELREKIVKNCTGTLYGLWSKNVALGQWQKYVAGVIRDWWGKLETESRKNNATM